MAVRATKDVDLLLRRADLPASARALARVGLYMDLRSRLQRIRERPE
jgi:hypothetical protein